MRMGNKKFDVSGCVGVVQEIGRNGEGQGQEEEDGVVMKKTVGGGWD